MGLFSWLRKPRRKRTRSEIERLLGLDHPDVSDLDKLRRLLGWVFRNSTYPNRAINDRARRQGVSPDLVDGLRAGDVSAAADWDQVDAILWACGAPHAAIEVAGDLFHDVRRAGRGLDPAADGVEGAPPTRPQGWTGQMCPILLTDVVDFGARTDEDGKLIRAAMYQIHRKAFKQADISQDDYRFGDRGDGILIVVSPKVAIKQLIHPLLPRIAEELSRHNMTAGGNTRFKLRIALHVGPVESDAEGVNGQVIVEAARLIDAPALKDRLAQASLKACVGFITSEFVYNRVIEQHPGQLLPAKYQLITGQRVKGYEFSAWIKLAPDPGAISGQTDP